MARRAITITTLLAGLLAVLLALVFQASDFNLFRRTGTKGEARLLVRGKNNTVLFITSEPNGLSNVHLATSFALLEQHPDVDVHIVSFPKLESSVDRISKAAKRRSATARSITWHELPGPDFGDAAIVAGKNVNNIVHKPGAAGLNQMAQDLQFFVAPWTGPEHLALYRAICDLIDEINPAVAVLDSLFRPAIDAVQEKNRTHAIVSANTVIDIFSGDQPRGQALWKYPIVGAHYPYPVPWRYIPMNVYMALRFAYTLHFMPALKETYAYLRENGVNKFPDFSPYRPDVPWISQSLPEAAWPAEVTPINVTTVGPIVVSVATAEEQDPALAAWLARRPTVLINLGSTVRYNEERARAMAGAVAVVLRQQPGIQVLWKFRKWGNFSDEFKEPLQEFLDQGRLKMESWLTVDPPSILESGHVAAFVHHGGSNCYHEAIATGVPQVILPLWFDLYNFATMIEYFGIGLWASHKTAPDWTVEEISSSLLRMLDGGKESISMRENAKKFADIVRERGVGRSLAAAEIAKLAASGY